MLLFFTSNLHFGSVHLAGGGGATAGIAVGADLPGEPPADRQVVHVLVVADLVVSTLQGAQVELVAAPGVVNPAVLACGNTVTQVGHGRDGNVWRRLKTRWRWVTAAHLCSSGWDRPQTSSR